MSCAFIIIGGGIIGAATALELQRRFPDQRIVLLEKEQDYACHQTGHNSGVIHAGVYYRPGSLKAELCRQGQAATMKFCEEQGIAYEQCGKLLVATSPLELQRMAALQDRIRQNGIALEYLDESALREKEPSIAGLAALYIGATGIVDYRKITTAMISRFRAGGGECHLGTEVKAIREMPDEVVVETGNADFHCGQLLVCAGLMADRLARMQGLTTDFRIIPFRGEYYQLPRTKNHIVRHLIYPVPDPAFPFLGVHLTRMIDGSVTVGPNAVLGFKREGYGRFNIDTRDLADMLTFPGFWRTMSRHLGSGIREFVNSVYKPGYLKQVQKYCPQLELNDLQPYPAGIRAQAVRQNGEFVEDFLFLESRRSLHVCNAPSPAATSAIPIARYICDKMQGKVS